MVSKVGDSQRNPDRSFDAELEIGFKFLALDVITYTNSITSTTICYKAKK